MNWNVACKFVKKKKFKTLTKSRERLFSIQYYNFDNDLSDLIDHDKPFSFENLHFINFQFIKLSFKHSYDEFKSKIDLFLQ